MKLKCNLLSWPDNIFKNPIKNYFREWTFSPFLIDYYHNINDDNICRVNIIITYICMICY